MWACFQRDLLMDVLSTGLCGLPKTDSLFTFTVTFDIVLLAFSMFCLLFLAS